MRVRPETGYVITLWLASWYPSAPAQLEVRINGTSIGKTVAPAEAGRWKEFRGSWNSANAVTARVEIFDLTTAFSGNDFAIDDISLREDPPATTAPAR